MRKSGARIKISCQHPLWMHKSIREVNFRFYGSFANKNTIWEQQRRLERIRCHAARWRQHAVPGVGHWTPHAIKLLLRFYFTIKNLLLKIPSRVRCESGWIFMKRSKVSSLIKVQFAHEKDYNCFESYFTMYFSFRFEGNYFITDFNAKINITDFLYANLDQVISIKESEIDIE